MKGFPAGLELSKNTGGVPGEIVPNSVTPLSRPFEPRLLPEEDPEEMGLENVELVLPPSREPLLALPRLLLLPMFV